MVLGGGSVMSRTDVVAALGTAPSWASDEMDDSRVVVIDEDSSARGRSTGGGRSLRG